MLENLPVLLLKKLVLLPYQEVRLELNVELSKKVIDQAENFCNNKLLNENFLALCVDEVLLILWFIKTVNIIKPKNLITVHGNGIKFYNQAYNESRKVFNR